MYREEIDTPNKGTSRKSGGIKFRIATLMVLRIENVKPKQKQRSTFPY